MANEAYVWIWLPGKTEPIVAGRLVRDGETLRFNYGQSYLARPDRIPIYEPELPLTPGQLPLPPGLSMPGAIRDGAPDAWGRRVIINRTFGHRRDHIDVGQLDELTYLLESGSDRIGALDFQRSPTDYVAREGRAASLDELMTAAERVETGVPLTPDLELALYHGSALGGARPKALIEDEGHKFIAKFSSSTDLFNVVKGEFIAMRLAERVGLDVAPVRLVRTAGRDVLLIERFDRTPGLVGWSRRGMVSALTLFELDEMNARYASYEDLTEIIRRRFDDPIATLRELFGRLVFNIIVGNTDDHARNHAAFWDGRTLRLTPAYDICPQGRAGNEATQAMLIRGQERWSRLSLCVEAASQFRLTSAEARELIDRTLAIVEDSWEIVCNEADMNEIDRRLLGGRQFLNPFALQGYRD